MKKGLCTSGLIARVLLEQAAGVGRRLGFAHVGNTNDLTGLSAGSDRLDGHAGFGPRRCATSKVNTRRTRITLGFQERFGAAGAVRDNISLHVFPGCIGSAGVSKSCRAGGFHFGGKATKVDAGQGTGGELTRVRCAHVSARLLRAGSGFGRAMFHCHEIDIQLGAGTIVTFAEAAEFRHDVDLGFAIFEHFVGAVVGVENRTNIAANNRRAVDLQHLLCVVRRRTIVDTASHRSRTTHTQECSGNQCFEVKDHGVSFQKTVGTMLAGCQRFLLHEVKQK